MLNQLFFLKMAYEVISYITLWSGCHLGVGHNCIWSTWALWYVGDSIIGHKLA